MKRALPWLVSLVLITALLLAACSSSPATTSSSVPPSTTATAAPTSSAPTSAPQTSATIAPTSSVPAPTTPITTKTYKFTYNNFFPPTHLNSRLAEQWIAEIKKRTGGAVTIDYFPGATLTAAAKVYDGVVSGISDIGFSVVAYTPGIFPATELIDYPHGYPSGYVATMASNDFYNNFKPAEFDKVHVFMFYATGPNVVFTTKKPVAKLEDMKGLVIRSTGIGASVATSLGATGYAAAQNEAYELMSKGVIDGSIAPREVLLGWKQAEVVKYVTESFGVGNVSNMYVVMNKDKWNSLPPEIQKIFTDVSQQFAQYHGIVSSYYDKAGMDYFYTQPGRQEIMLDATEMARWINAALPLVTKAKADIKAKNLPAEDYDTYLDSRIKYWTANSPSDADCATWVKANLP